jgi:phosphoglucosamine mutase
VTLHEAKRGMSKFPQQMINVPRVKYIDLATDQQVKRAVLDAEQQLDGRGRVLLRPSGTEPLIRVMVEGEDDQLVDRLVHQIANTVRQRVA